MVTDFNDSQSANLFNCDLCIVGAGAAGITIAKEFDKTGKNVILIESGDTEYEHEIQELYDGDAYITEGPTRRVSDVHQLKGWRLRHFGGTTMHWTGGCSPFEKIDFMERPWVEDSGWPIDLSDLDQYYRRAEKIAHLSSSEYSEKIWNTLGITPFEFDKDKIVTFFGQRSGFVKDYGFANWSDGKGGVGAVRFGKMYRKELFKSKNINVLLHANVVDLVPNENNDHINYVTISNISKDNTAKIKAKAYILCTGGLENPRILLNSANREKGGFANNNGLVGKYYLGHPYAEFATLHTNNNDNANKLVHDFTMDKVVNKNLREPRIHFSDLTQHDREMLNIGVWIRGRPDYSSGVYSAMKLRDAISNKTYPNNLPGKVLNVLRDIDDVMIQMYRNNADLGVKMPMSRSVRLWGIVEQAPIRDSRIYLSTSRDRLGLNKIVLDWRLNGQEKHSMREAAKILGNEFGRLNIGRLKIDDWLFEDDNLLGPISDAAHPAGTTRMSNNSNDGVVDINCKSHFVDNLYLSGSSVFPTNSYHSPTLTIVALSLRLADHLKRFAFS